MGSTRDGVDVVVIGAGIVGLAVGAALARAGRSLIVLEREAGIARGVTSRSSEVVHAGLYYPAGSLKAESCVRGRVLLAEHCARHRVPYRETGKLVVANGPADAEALERLAERAAANGVALEAMSARAVAELEPAVRCDRALHSPRSGIVDSHALALSLAAGIEAQGGVLSLRHEVVGAVCAGSGFRLEVRDAEGRVENLACELLVNAAGLGADRVASLAGIDVDAAGYRLHPCKGDYFALAPGAGLRLARLVYPVPDPERPGLGIHATVDLAGGVRFGPDAEFRAPDDAAMLRVDPAKAAAFGAALRCFLPSLEDAWLTPAYAGVRPRLAGPGGGFRDFVVAEESGRGRPGLIDCIGIESPGLTAALALAERVAQLAGVRA